MSDKMFFMGRIDARENHVAFGYEAKSSVKLGTKKRPLVLVVTSEARKQSVEALVAEAKLHAVISVDASEGAVESIAELTALLGKTGTVTVEKTPARNDPCICGSGKKFKKCCG